MSQSGPKGFFDLFGKKSSLEDVYEDEIINIVNEGHEQGAIQNQEAEMISKIFNFSDKDAKDIMTIRKKIVGLEKSMTLKEAVDFVIEQNYSRFPLYDEDIDNIVGVLHLKDIFKAYVKTPEVSLEDIAEDAYYVHEAQDISDMFDAMQKKKQHMAIVIDEYGQTSGIVAMEDILEVIVGNIFDEHDEVEKDIYKLARPDEYMIKGLTRLDDISEQLGIEFPEEDIDTLNGFMINDIGHLPKPEENIEVTVDGYMLKAISVKDNIITLVKVVKMTRPAEEDE